MSDLPDPDPEIRLKRLRFRASHRGFREADIILGSFAAVHAETLSDEELTAFEALLEQSDHAIYNWILGREPAPEAFDGPVLARLRAHLPAAHLFLADH